MGAGAVKKFHRALAMLLLAAAMPAIAAADRSGDTQTIRLQVTNATTDDLRCVAILAHFVTRDLAPLARGESLELGLARHAVDGSLAFDSHGDSPMLLENILCGRSADWQASRQDLPLLPMRSGDGREFHVTCRREGERLACRLP